MAVGGAGIVGGMNPKGYVDMEAALAQNGLKVTRKREKNGWVALEAVLA